MMNLKLFKSHKSQSESRLFIFFKRAAKKTFFVGLGLSHDLEFFFNDLDFILGLLNNSDLLLYENLAVSKKFPDLNFLHKKIMKIPKKIRKDLLGFKKIKTDQLLMESVY
ncbi:hypothetical protein BpHYR1_050870 [Brachionus plicatilis]|uniref:Uncharacterized protein n=1 Tax=Brachionus plicatilis TaxID=10195 RepID=A0A3M7PSX0_BRAPC|nr:hypothetical protein BpHYR1_050870 [Brachionus plicatilis]